MPLTNFPNGLSSFGIPVVGAGPIIPAGSVFFVSSTGSIGDGTSRDTPLATIAAALLKCVANRGDVIFVLPLHAETISNATTLVLNVAGVSIIGLGSGSNRPTLTFSTATTANIPVTAANITVTNILHKANFADIVSAYTATGTNTPTDFTLTNCEFRDGSSVLNFIKTFAGNATANSCDGLNYSFNRVFGLSTTAATQCCIMAAANDRQTYADNYAVYPVLNDTAVLVDFGANSQTDLFIARNRTFRPSTSTTGGSLFSGGSTASTGYVVDNYSWHLDNSAGLLAPTGTKLGFQNNYSMITGAADKSGLINPAAV